MKAWTVTGFDCEGQFEVMGIFTTKAKAVQWVKDYHVYAEENDEMLMDMIEILDYKLDPKDFAWLSRDYHD